MRIRAVGEPAKPQAGVLPQPLPPPPGKVEPTRVSAQDAASSGPAGSVRNASTPGSPEGGGGGTGGGAPGGEGAPGPGATAPVSQYGAYLERLRSEGVQGWARESARAMRQGWRGSGKGGAGFGAGTGSGRGGASGSGSGTGGGGGGERGAVYLDPRVEMVVKSDPPTSIEQRHTQVRYPDLMVKKHEYAAGWREVWIQLHTDAEGKVSGFKILRPETDGPLERIFVAQVRKEVERWTFDRTPAEINVSVRFRVE